MIAPIRITIPRNNCKEREYIIGILLSEFLGIKYEITIKDDQKNYCLYFFNKELIIIDDFFGNYPQSMSYYNYNSIPEKVEYTSNQFLIEDDIPIIYGSEDIFVSENKIICGIDIFASSYFMLTRWEETLSDRLDTHGRFPGIISLAYKNGFLNRPVVNEYAEFLKNMLTHLGLKGVEKKGKFEIILSHDIDELKQEFSWRILIADLLKRRSFSLFQSHLKHMISFEPITIFEYLMTVSENIGVKSYFYFMSSDNRRSPFEFPYSLNGRRFREIIATIKNRGHNIGFHPGYNTFRSQERWEFEKRLLDSSIKEITREGRQHYLRFDFEKTLDIWEDNFMQIDSTLGYADKEGFRCGTGDVFTLFNIFSRRKLNLQERPLIVMDTTLFEYQNYSIDQAKKTLGYYVNIGRKYNSQITFLFHNSSFYLRWEGKCNDLFESVIDVD